MTAPSTPPVVELRWRDSLSGIGGWHEVGTAEKHAVEAWDEPLYAAGFLVVDAPDYVVVASGFNPVHEGEPEVNGTVMIPRSEIVSITELRAAVQPPDAPPVSPHGFVSEQRSTRCLLFMAGGMTCGQPADAAIHGGATDA